MPFISFIEGDLRCWVDIANLDATVPIRKKEITMKVIVIEDQRRSKIFKRYKPFSKGKKSKVSSRQKMVVFQKSF